MNRVWFHNSIAFLAVMTCTDSRFWSQQGLTALVSLPGPGPSPALSTSKKIQFFWHTFSNLKFSHIKNSASKRMARLLNPLYWRQAKKQRREVETHSLIFDDIEIWETNPSIQSTESTKCQMQTKAFEAAPLWPSGCQKKNMCKMLQESWYSAGIVQDAACLWSPSNP